MFYSGDEDYFNFETTPNMPTYLIAFVVSDFGYKNTTRDFHVWARKGALAQLDYRARVGPELLDAMVKFLLGLEYQLPKLDEVSVPDFSAGAMENWGLTTYR
jgi:aminopeptidase N